MIYIYFHFRITAQSIQNFLWNAQYLHVILYLYNEKITQFRIFNPIFFDKSEFIYEEIS